MDEPTTGIERDKEGHIAWPPEPTWENAHRLVSGALRWWDKWCPDDGRPRIALAAAEAYHSDPTEKHLQMLMLSAEALERARDMASKGVRVHPTKGTRMLAEPPGVALYAALALHRLIWPVLFPGMNREKEWAEAIENAGAANIFGFMYYGDPEGEDDGL